MAAEDNLSHELFYHVSNKDNRESIESAGLIPNKWMETAPKGVYMNPGWANAAYAHGEGDIYEIKPHKKTKLHSDPIDPGAVYSRRTITPKEFKRVGHVYQDEHGEQTHWHPEEHCQGRED